MGVGAHDLIGVVKVINHRLPFFYAIVFYYRFFLFFGLQMKRHTYCIRFRMKLRSNHVFIKPDGHYCSFKWNMWPRFFYRKNSSAHLFYGILVWLNYLKIPAIYRVKRIFQSFKNGFILCIR